MLTGRRAAARDDRGVTLVELLVAMVLAGIIGGLTLRLVVTVDASATATSDRTLSTDRAMATLQAWGEYLEVTDDPSASGSTQNRFEWFSNHDVVFHADLYNRGSSTAAATATTGAPTTVWLRLDSKGALVEEQFAGTPAAYPAAPTVCRTLVPLAGSTQLFTAFDADGNDLSGLDLGTAPAVGPGCQSLPAALPSVTAKPDAVAVDNLSTIASVQIDYTVTDSAASHPLEFSTTVSLPTIGTS